MILLEDLLEESFLKTWGIVRDKSRMTTFKERIVSESQQICRVDYETKTHLDSNIQSKLIERILEFSNSHSSIILEDYGKGLLTQEVCAEVFKLAKEKNLSVAVDPSRTTPPLWYKGASLLKPNFLEASLMVKSLGYLEEMKVSEMAKILIDKLSLDQVIITLGSKGMGMIDAKGNGQYIEIPTVAREVFDVSGAGDTAISAIMASISAGASLEEAAWIGNCASGVVVGKRGTALVTSEELSDFYINLKKSL
jgi:rfaE bifunctional protein kinase chain/domain